MKLGRPLATLLLGWMSAIAGTNSFNYAEALQKSLYFYEAQQSGVPSPNNRVEWRGPACLDDGRDIGRDLSGGWFDAGDQWTANLTMSFAAMTLAWSAIEAPEGYRGIGQMDELLESLIHVNRYFLKCVLHPDKPDPTTDLEVVIGCGGREGVEDPKVHSMWAPAEVAHLMTRRPTFRLNREVPGGDIPGAMAAAMAAGSMVIREHGGMLRGRRGYEGFDPGQFADLLLDRAEKLTLFARASSGPAITEATPEAAREKIRRARVVALRSDGQVVEVGYRADPFDKVFAAASFLQRAHRARDPGCDNRWFDLASQVYEHEYKAENNHDWWKDFGAGHLGKVGAYNMMRLRPGDERFHAELQLYCSRFCEYRRTPGGLGLREWSAHEYGSLRHANNAAVIALYYSRHVDSAPPLSGNTWWKANRSNAELHVQYLAAARRPVEYALGANPYGRSYLVGFGNRPFNHPHHRGAFGAWAGFDHFIPGKADDRRTNRHVLYGALLAGPDHNDVFLGGAEHRKWLPLPDGRGEGFLYRFSNRPGLVEKEGYQWNDADQPYQDVMDSTFNEVALDYNAGITASLAWLTAHGSSDGGPLPDSVFPPRESRFETEDLWRTDREYFVTARRIRQDPRSVDIEATLNNRSRWPATVRTNLSFRMYFTCEPGVTVGEVSVTVLREGSGTVSPVHQLRGDSALVEVSFPGEAIFPGNLQHSQRTVRLRWKAPSLDLANDASFHRLASEPQLLPEMPVYDSGRRLGGVEP